MARKAEPHQLVLPLEPPPARAAFQEQIVLGGKIVVYTVNRSDRRRTISLTIDERGLRVSAPARASPRAIERELQRHGGWVLRKLAEWQARRAPPLAWRDGETLMWLGRALRLTLRNGHGDPQCESGRLVVSTAEPPNSTAIERQVITWLRDQALACFQARTVRYLPVLEVPAPEIRLSNARTRWGSCHPDGRILLNWRLVQMPLRLIDYVIVHELAHLREMNHSFRFWRIVARVFPDYPALRKEIRGDAYRYLVV